MRVIYIKFTMVVFEPSALKHDVMRKMFYLKMIDDCSAIVHDGTSFCFLHFTTLITACKRIIDIWASFIAPGDSH